MSDARSAPPRPRRYVCGRGRCPPRTWRPRGPIATSPPRAALVWSPSWTALPRAPERIRWRVFAASIEELDEHRRAGRRPLHRPGRVRPRHRRRSPVGRAQQRPADRRCEDDLVAIEWHVPGDPVVLTFGIGPWISVGFNSAGLALTGNELSPNDNRVGIPRLLQVRDMIRRPDGRPRRCRPRCTRAGRRRTTTCSATATETS